MKIKKIEVIKQNKTLIQFSKEKEFLGKKKLY